MNRQMGVPQIRIRALNAAPLRPKQKYVVYWMVAARRLRANFALQRAVELAREFDRPLLVLEALRCDYPNASDRLHRFILDGMCDHEEALRESPVLYYPYVEPSPGAGRGLLLAVAERACAVVTDDSFAAFMPRIIEAAGRLLPVRAEAVDSNGLLPLRAPGRMFQTAASFRAYLRKHLGPHLSGRPLLDPRSAEDLRPLPDLGRDLERRWPRAPRALLDGSREALAALPIDHSVPVVAMRGGPSAARARLKTFLRSGLERYPEDRARPEVDGTSRLSPYLHFGHLGVHEIVSAIERREGRPLELSQGRAGLFKGAGAAEAFLDELVTWRELALNMASRRSNAHEYETLPEWARRALAKHASDPRPRLVTRDALERGDTGDAVLDAAQRQLMEEGWFHNRARMIWGKKILEYSASPEVAFRTLLELMDRYALDGRDPNSVAGAAWVFGRYDRPWGPERPIFGTVRYMTSTSPAKLRELRAWVERYRVKSRTNADAGDARRSSNRAS